MAVIPFSEMEGCDIDNQAFTNALSKYPCYSNGITCSSGSRIILPPQWHTFSPPLTIIKTYRTTKKYTSLIQFCYRKSVNFNMR